jgi:hypothetical protein
VLGGLAIVRLVDRLNLDHGLLPIFVLTLSLMVFAAARAIGGSGFLAVYLAGLVAGNSDIRAVTILKRFQDGMSWLAQIIMFLILGLFATPSQFPAIIVPAALLGLFLMFVARPVAVWLCLIPFRLPRPEVAFVSWVGLRGAVSILLAITPLLGGLENGRLIFNTAFIIVLVSLVVQGWTNSTGWVDIGSIVPARLGPPGQGRSWNCRAPPSRASPTACHRSSPVARGACAGAALAGAARRTLHALPGHGQARRRRPRLHLRAGPLSPPSSTSCSPAAPVVDPGGRGFLRRVRRRSPRSASELEPPTRLA